MVRASRAATGEIECAVSLTRWTSPNDLEAYLAAGATRFIVSLGRPALDLPWDFDRVTKVLAWHDSRK